MGAVPGGVDRGEAAAAAVDDVACGGEREGRHRDAESRGRGEQVEHARQATSVDRAFSTPNALGVEMSELFTAFTAVPHPPPD